MVSNKRSILVGWVADIEGRECWAVSAGGCVGSRFTLYLGGKIRRKRELTNPNLSVEQREFDAEFLLFARDSPWVLQGPRGVVATYDFDCHPDGPLVLALKLLDGQTVRSASLDPAGLKLDVEFSLGHILTLPTSINAEDEDAYMVFSRDHIIAVKKDGVLEYEARTLG